MEGLEFVIVVRRKPREARTVDALDPAEDIRIEGAVAEVVAKWTKSELTTSNVSLSINFRICLAMASARSSTRAGS